MSRSRIYILIPVIFYLFLLCSNVVNAQVSIQGTGVSTHSFNYSTADTGIFNSPRQLLHYLAGAKSADPARMELRFQYDLTIGATQVSNQGVSIQFSINNGMMVGNSRFRNFDISTQLLPNFMNATLLVKNLTTGDTVITEPINSIKITNGSSQMHEVKVKLPSLSNPLQISLSEIRFYHLPDFSNKILSQIVLINEHEAALFLLKHCSNLLEGINCRHPDHIPECFLNLLAIERILVKVEQSRFDERLMLPPHDPAGFLRRFELIKNKHSLMSRDFLSTLRQTRTIYPTKLDEELVMQYVDEISRINMLASEAGFAYAPYISDLARLQIVSERADSLSQLTREIAVKLAGSGSGHNNYTRLMNMAYNAMLSEARSRLQANDYHNALVMFNNSMKFCGAFPEVECKPAVFQEISKAHHGLYDSYLSVARRAMEIGRPELAERYIRLAAEYQQNNSSSIITNIRVTEMNVRLFDAFVEKARQFNNLAAFDTAAAMLKRAANPEIGITPTQGWRNQMAIARNGQLRNLIAALQSETKLNRTTRAIDAWQKVDSFIEQEIKTPALLPQTVQLMQEATNNFSRLLVAAASDDFRNKRFDEVLNKFLIIEDLESYGVILPASAFLTKKQTGRLIVDSLMMSV
ncbi:MAG TPA: hypothetical protein VLH16_00820, partial [Bacteroidales bacterium]|nr:hypothetical protein [Bacteroidales bacterium]